VVLVEAPLDAIAAIAMHPDAIAIASGGDQLPPSKLALWIPEGAEVLAGYDADRRGDQVADQAAEQFNAKRFKPSRKDWAETVKTEPWRVNQAWDESEASKDEKNALRPVLRPR
jgi:DNA primase